MNIFRKIYRWLWPVSNKQNVTGVHERLYWNKAEMALDAGFKVSNIRWAKTEWLYKRDGKIMRHSKSAGDTPYPVTETGWVKYGSGNTWCVVGKV